MKPSQYKSLLRKRQQKGIAKAVRRKIRVLPTFGRMSLTTGQETDLDKDWSLAVKIRAGMKCEKCGKTKTLQSHHAVGKRWKQSLRHVVGNGVSLCARHHMWAEQHGIDFAQWIISVRGQVWWDELNALGGQVKIFKEYSIVKAYLKTYLTEEKVL